MITVADAAALEKVVRRLAPADTGVAAREVNASLVAELTARERALVRAARPIRQAEFATGRCCAHRALAAIGADVDTIGRGGRSEPVWPAGITGSISHAGGLAAAVATRVGAAVGSLGLDVEQADHFETELWPHVLTPSEHDRCSESPHPVAAATAVFSAKEAAFKALFPLLRVEIDFLEAHTTRAGGFWQVEFPHLGASVAVCQDVSGPLVVSLAVVAATS
jgi:4'-phosphopantetheinyl transferase EntD